MTYTVLLLLQAQKKSPFSLYSESFGHKRTAHLLPLFNHKRILGV